MNCAMFSPVWKSALEALYIVFITGSTFSFIGARDEILSKCETKFVVMLETLLQTQSCYFVTLSLNVLCQYKNENKKIFIKSNSLWKLSNSLNN